MKKTTNLLAFLFTLCLFFPFQLHAINLKKMVKDVSSKVKNPKEAVNPKSKGGLIPGGGGNGIFSKKSD